MIKHSVKDELIHLSINNEDFAYRIPVVKIGNTIDWKIGSKGSKGIVIQNASKWALQLFTKNVTEDKYVKQFQKIVKEFDPKADISWEATFLAVNIQNKYNWMMSENAKDKKISEEEIISTLKDRFKLN